MTVDQIYILILFSALHLFGFANAVHAVLKGRTAQGTVAWILFLIILPYVAIPLYWIFGPRKFNAYTRALSKAREAHSSLLQEQLAAFSGYITGLDENPSVERVLKDFDEWPITSGNEVHILNDGQNTFKAIFEAISAAEKYILVSFYIVRADRLGNELKDRLIERARNGVAVHFMFDPVGSFSLTNQYCDDLREAGVQVAAFRTTKGFKNRWKLNFRNHRKIVIVDGKVGFVGGVNVGIEYLGEDPHYGPWRDIQVQMFGPSVLAVQMLFAKDWFWAAEKPLDVEWKTHPAGDKKILPVSTGPIGPMDLCTILFLAAINQAKERFWIASPYLIPDEQITNTLKLAVLRGVDVRILIPYKPDHMAVYLVGVTYWRSLTAAGVKLYRYKAAFLHQKAFIVDDWWSAVGTANLDNRSMRLNFELTVCIFDKAFTRELEDTFEVDFAQSEEITLELCDQIPILVNTIGRICRLFSPLL